MKKATTNKKKNRQQNSVSENFILRLRHSRKSQLASILVIAVGLAGIYLVMAAFAPANYGENLNRKALDPRGESLRDRVSLRVNDTFNRLNFVVSGEKDNPEWIQPVNLPAPPDEVRSSLPDKSTFGNVGDQFLASLPEQERQTIPEVVPTSPTPAPQPPSQPVVPSSQTIEQAAQVLAEACVYEKELEE